MRRKTDNSHQKQYWQHKDQENDINQKKSWKKNNSMDVLSD